ncbi:hypothetical protein RF11_13349 [Thelohanellus kitauei]|uniref:Uncharacterized protein n=1 Tax=Thelohanellus kitauei TaxID=669202 RepID=A0A0C2NFN2_THEKT|nr:hypothetical protein RF11_13349 [Thelohanellus kitauei]
MEEKQNEFTEVEKIQKKGKDREIPPIEMSEENIRAMLDYFGKINSYQILPFYVQIFLDPPKGLLNQRKSMKNEMEALQSQLDKLSETEKQLVQFQVLCEQYNQELKNKELAPNFQNLKERVNDLQDQNRRFLDEMFQLAQTRESFEMYEKSLVDRIVFEYKQKREETSSMTEQLHQFIQEFQQQQNPISRSKSARHFRSVKKPAGLRKNYKILSKKSKKKR